MCRMYRVHSLGIKLCSKQLNFLGFTVTLIIEPLSKLGVVFQVGLFKIGHPTTCLPTHNILKCLVLFVWFYSN